MAKLSDRDRILPGYTHRDPFGNPLAPPHRSSDVDFRDVFGGPPRQHSSVYEPRRRRAGSLDSRPSTEGGSGGSLPEKPVFGESDSPARRSHLGDDFFNDIFPGSDSCCSSPRKPDRDPIASSPGSRVLSPTRPLPPRCEPFVGGSSLPAQLSLSMKLAKRIDQPTFNSPTHRASLSMEVQSPKDPTSLEGYVRSNRFHFSIYKWAGKGVTLIMPSSTKEKNESRLRRLPEVVLQGVGLPSYDDNMPITIIKSKNQSENQDKKLLKDLIMGRNDDAVSTCVEELLPVGSKSKFLRSGVTEESDSYNDKSRKVPVTLHEGRKPEIKNLRQLFDDDMDKQGKEDIVGQVEETENFSRGQRNVYGDANAKQQAGRENSMNHAEVISPSMQDVQVSVEDKMHGSRVKGKVKEFIKIFNREPSSKCKGIFETQDRRAIGKDWLKSKVQEQVSNSATKMVEEVKASSRTSAVNTVEVKASSRNSNKSMLDTPTAINQILKANISDSTTCFDVLMINDSSSERKETSGPFYESNPEIIGASICNAGESHCEDLEDFLVEQLSQDQNERLQTDSHQDQIKISDAKIREWSKGKEGNIRSLLSTLHYVLWPESGWKPVPLVDIVEGASVKRAYQKALLCLHPDKLQQKGAAMHQKYIAEKVFVILQEAWNQFNLM